jgi:hypothetical protein
VLTAAATLCLAATGTAAVTWAAPSASPAQATDMLSFHSLTRAPHAATAQLTARLNAAQPNLAQQAVMVVAADRAAAAHAAAIMAARAAAERRAAHRAAARRAAAGTPEQIAGRMLAKDGLAGQFACLDALWAQESSWNVSAENPSSGAYGIPQALPGSKMSAAGPDWQSDAATQISWGLGYIRATYGTPCAAWGHEEATGWY